nr:GntR family transcriptional regulator [Pullulanibacillus pueri]
MIYHLEWYINTEGHNRGIHEVIRTATPLYEKIYQSLKEEIMNNRYKIGDRIPSEKELAELFGVSRITTKRALEMLARDEFIIRKPGRGSFVSRQDLQKTPPVHEEDDAQEPMVKKKEENILIGMIITDFDSSFGLDVLTGVEEASDDNTFLLLHRTHGHPENEEIAIQQLIKTGVQGLIIVPSRAENFSPAILKLAVEQFPFVLVDRRLKGIATYSVASNNVVAAREAVEYLFKKGHKNIGLLSPPPLDSTTVEERIEGFVQAHAEKGIAIDKKLWMNDIISTLPDQFSEENIKNDIQKIKRKIMKNPQMTALLAIEYNIALEAESAIKALGLRIPEDIAIICFDHPRDHVHNLKFTYIQQPQVDMGRTAKSVLLKLIKKEKLSKNKFFLDAHLIEGPST